MIPNLEVQNGNSNFLSNCRLGKKLIEPLTNLIHSTSAMSLLYECINTVIAVLISISTGMRAASFTFIHLDPWPNFNFMICASYHTWCNSFFSYIVLNVLIKLYIILSWLLVFSHWRVYFCGIPNKVKPTFWSNLPKQKSLGFIKTQLIANMTCESPDLGMPNHAASIQLCVQKLR